MRLTTPKQDARQAGTSDKTMGYDVRARRASEGRLSRGGGSTESWRGACRKNDACPQTSGVGVDHVVREGAGAEAGQ